MRHRGHFKWAKREDAALRAGWGLRDLGDLAAQFDRTPLAVRVRARALGLPLARQGTKSLVELAASTGYDDTRIRGAVARLGMVVDRAPAMFNAAPPLRGRPLAFTEEQELEIVAFLATVPDGRKLYSGQASATDSWQWGVGGKPAACIDCARSDVQHAGRGRCRACFQMARRARVRAARCATGWRPRTVVATVGRGIVPAMCLQGGEKRLQRRAAA